MLPNPRYFLPAVTLMTFIIALIFMTIVKGDEIDQIQVIAEVIAAESASQGYEGMYLVANTIKNRAILRRISPYGVVCQKNQYYGYTNKNRAKIYASVRNKAYWLAEHIMELPDKTNGAIYFRQIGEPKFKWCKIETVRYKNHIFYK